MYNEVILTKFNTLGNKRKMLLSVFSMICGSDFGKMKYVSIDGLGLESVKNKCIGANDRLYLESLVDAISILEGMNSEESVTLCNKDHAFYTKAFGIKSGNLSFAESAEEILNNWGSLGDGDLGYEESEYDRGDEYDEDDENNDDLSDNKNGKDEEDVSDDSKEDKDNTDTDDEDKSDEETVIDKSEEVLRKCISRAFSSTISSLNLSIF